MKNPRSSSSPAERRSRILVIEDELLIALMIEEMVRDAGLRVSGVAQTPMQARQELAKRNFDAVLLDFNIGGQFHPEIADLLLEAGVPFAFVTGYDYVVEPRHERVPMLQKPFNAAQLRDLLERLVGPRSTSEEVAQPATHAPERRFSQALKARRRGPT
jgi:DNA-binding NtrC family response regulator